MRHAKAEDGGEAPDHERGLSARGKHDARRMGEELSAHDLVPDAVIASDAKRARGTARRVAEACAFGGTVELNPGLYTEGIEPHLAALAALPDAVERVLLVAHNPAMEELATHLTGSDVRLPTAAVACVDLAATRWSDVNRSTRGVLRLLLTPHAPGG